MNLRRLADRAARVPRWAREGWIDYNLGLPSRRVARRSAARGFYLGGGVILTRVLERYSIYLPTRDTSLVPGLLLHGYWEPWVTRTLATLLRPGMVVADVGANVGYFTLLMAGRVGAEGHVHAFDPNAELCRLVSRSLLINGLAHRCTVHETALSDEDGREMLLCLPGDALGGAAISPPPGHEVEGAHPVLTRRLDSIPGADRIELVKIDAEGSEPAIWAGMTGLIEGRALRTVLLEFASAAYPNPAAFLDSIERVGFRVRLIDNDRGVLTVDRAWLLAPERATHALMLLLER